MSEKRTDNDIDESRIIIRQGRATMWVGIICMLFWAALIVFMTIIPNDTATLWVYATFVAFFLLGAGITLAYFFYEIKVDGNEIHRRSSFGKTKVFNFKSIKSAIEKQHPSNKKQKSLDIYSETELLFTVESNCIGYDIFVSRLQSEGIEFALTSGIQISLGDPAKAHAKAEKKAREKQKAEEKWADFEERYPEKAKQHRRFCKILNSVGFAYYLLIFPARLFDAFLSIGTALFSLVAIALFIIAAYYCVMNSHIINMGEKRGCPKPGLYNAVLAPGIFLGLAALDIYPIVYNFRTWTVFLIVALVISSILLFTARERGVKKGALFSLVVCAFVFSYGASVAVNCELDFSKPEVNVVHIERKSAGSRNAPHTVVVEFLLDGTSDRVRIPVSRNEFERLEVGDIFILNTKTGLLGIRWVP